MHKIKSYTLLALSFLVLVALRLLLYWERLPLFLDTLIYIFLIICSLLFCFEFFALAYALSDCCYNWQRRRRLLRRLRERQS